MNVSIINQLLEEKKKKLIYIVTKKFVFEISCFSLESKHIHMPSYTLLCNKKNIIKCC